MPPDTVTTYTRIKRTLDRVYLAAGYASGACIVAIFAITMFQIIARWLGYNPLGLTAYAGYFMAASAFLGLAHTLNSGAHVRIEMFLSLMGPARHYAERVGFVASAAIACWLAYYATSTAVWSYWLGDISTEMDATPIWIPQSTMAFGSILLAVAVIDHGLRLLITGDHDIIAAPDAV
jgi:TRAP-type C4-dicarboxylate transport system permease small subunit